MASIQISVGDATKSIKLAQSTLNKFADRASDFAPVLNYSVNNIINDLAVKQFDTAGRFGGTPWQELSPMTVLMRKARGSGRGGIGRDTNRLWAAWTKFGLGPDAIKIVTPTSLQRSVRVKYDKWFQRGFKSKTVPVKLKDGRIIFVRRKLSKIKNIPGRPIIPPSLPDKTVKAIVKAINEWLTEGKV